MAEIKEFRFRRTEDGELRAWDSDIGAYVIPNRDVKPDTTYVGFLYRSDNGQYVATGLTLGRWDTGDAGEFHLHRDQCTVCEEARIRARRDRKCKLCGAGADPNSAWPLCRACYEADQQAYREQLKQSITAMFRAEWDRIEAWRAQILSRPLPDLPVIPAIELITEQQLVKKTGGYPVYQTRCAAGHTSLSGSPNGPCPECVAQRHDARIEAERRYKLAALQRRLRRMSDEEILDYLVSLDLPSVALALARMEEA